MKNESSIKHSVSSNQFFNNKILIIDDEQVVIDSIEYHLKRDGYKVFSALNGKIGMEIYKKEKPVLIILDIRMPVMDGIEFLKHINLKTSNPFSVIVLTAHGSDDDVEKCFKMGVSAFLRKPFNLFELKGLVKHSIDLKEAHQELCKHRDHLEELVDIRTLELKSTQERLVQAEKLAATGKLSASIAHEFNNPICAIRSVLQFLEDKLIQKDKKLIVMAIRECDKMKNFIEKLNDFYRPATRMLTPIDINITIDEMLMLCLETLKTNNIEVRKNYESNLPKIYGAPDQIKQAILHILVNAEQAIVKEKGMINIRTEIVETKIKISIQDNGRGVDKKNIKSIFEPFFTTKAVQGLGLGLSVSYGIIKKHGGDINVESHHDNGTTFTITLPVAEIKS